MINKLLIVIGITIVLGMVFLLSRFLPGESSVAQRSATAAVSVPTPTQGKLILQIEVPERVELGPAEIYTNLPITITATQDGKLVDGVEGRLTVGGNPDPHPKINKFKTARGKAGFTLSLVAGDWRYSLYDSRAMMVATGKIIVVKKAPGGGET